MKVARVAEMRAMDRRMVEEFSVPEETLMENAGLAARSLLMHEIGMQGKRCAILCGSGNNGGDGLVVARALHSAGVPVKIFLAADAEKFRGAAGANLAIVRKLPIEIERVNSAKAIRSELRHRGVLVDALLGTGLDRDVTGLFRDLIELVNESGKTIVSLDIPSGINGDTGSVMGSAVQADYTVTFGLPKVGNMLYPGFERGGKLRLSHISFPPALYDDNNLKIQINDSIHLPDRSPEAHKGSMGKVLFIAGATNYYGAPYFSAMSFLKAGGGYAYLAAPRSAVPFIAQQGNEIVFLPQKETIAGSIAANNRRQLLDLVEKMDFVVLGPGVSLVEETQLLVRELVAAIKKPLLIDGDGLTALAGDLSLLKERPGPTILTPHLGELARLTGKSIAQLSENKISELQAAQRDTGSFLIMKGPHSLIGIPEDRVFINLSGNSGMATAGSGDVLTGIIAAMFCLGLSLGEALKKGVFIHGFAGDLAAESKGEDGITARDILENVPLAMKHDRAGDNDACKNRYEMTII